MDTGIFYEQHQPTPQWLGASNTGDYYDMYRYWLHHSLADLRILPPEQTNIHILEVIKKSIKQIKAEAVSEEARTKLQSKIDRLEKLGVRGQATVLKAELKLRMKLAKVQEWDYKVLPSVMVEAYRLRVCIEPLEKYTGMMGLSGESEEKATDRIIPDFVLDKLEEAKDRQIFDDFAVLWVEKVKDPLLLGVLHGCKDYFLICEWGEDVKFDDLVKENEKS